jgi:hypothetical protein
MAVQMEVCEQQEQAAMAGQEDGTRKALRLVL